MKLLFKLVLLLISCHSTISIGQINVVKDSRIDEKIQNKPRAVFET
jgi:Na+-translocating ferredoxin:NAD+ oxidoreductase RnfG subunit